MNKNQIKKGDRVRFIVQGTDKNEGTVKAFKRDGSIVVRQISANKRTGINWWLAPTQIVEVLQ